MNRLKLLVVTVCALAGPALLGVGPAHAQPEGDVPRDTGAVDEALDLYWAKKRELKTIQKRLYLKDSRWEFTLFSGVIPNDEFFSYFPIGGRINHYLQEDISVELWGAYDVSLDSELKDFLEENTLYQILVEIPQTLVWMAGADVLWSPIHGKIGMFTSKLAHFDFHLAFGAGVIGTEIVNEATKEVSSKIDVSGNLGVGFRLFFNDTVALRLDYRQYFYPAETGGVAYPAELTLGVSFFTAAPK